MLQGSETKGRALPSAVNGLVPCRPPPPILAPLGIADCRSQISMIFNLKFAICNPEGHARALHGSSLGSRMSITNELLSK
jgi:hypothetical protein